MVVAEDDEDIAAIISEALGAGGSMEPIVVSNGALVIDAVMQSGAGLLILDVQMPGASGIDVYDIAKPFDLDDLVARARSLLAEALAA